MTALLDLPEVRDRVHRVSVSDYRRLGELGMISEDVELLRGIIVKKMSKSPLHEFVSERLLDILRELVPDGLRVRQERPLSLEDSVPEPDLSVVPGKPSDWLSAHPSSAVLVVEIAIATVPLDRNKAEIYAQAGIPEYWLVRAEERQIDIYRKPAEGSYEIKLTLGVTDLMSYVSIPGIQFRVGEVFPVR
jgi:Uma2 family endonuclease